MEKKIIIFGAGNYGKMALENYGPEKVKYFLDNNENKIGKLYCDKKVIGFDEFLEIYHSYTVVIASNYLGQMSEQLEENNIYEYEYYMPYYKKTLTRIKEEIAQSQYKGIALYGFDNTTKVLMQNLITQNQLLCPLFLIDSDNSNYIGKIIAGYQVQTLRNVIDKVDCIIIVNGKYAITIGARLEKLMSSGIRVINPFRQRKYYETNEIVFNPYNAQSGEKTEEEWNKQNEDVHMIDAINDYVEEVHNNVPLFKYIEIETLNKCNGVCSFCPVNKKIDPREEKLMTREMYESIILQLKEMNYRGNLSTFSNNEPLLDSRIVELNEYARKQLPNAHIHMFSNGTLFTLDIFIDLIQYLDELIIDNYRQDLQLIKPCREIAEYCEDHPELKEKVTIVLRKPNEILTSRGGDAPNRNNVNSYNNCKCALPYEQMTIRPDGKVSLCCNDPLGKVTLGDLTKERVLDVWYGEAYQNVRNALQSGRSNFEHCKYCDTFYLY
ncbi:MAG: SPASM domain-containing protein [Ruminiclostridium sp.]